MHDLSSGTYYTESFIRRAAVPVMFSIMPLKMIPWKGRIEYQYNRPARPFGKKIAR